jgi:hypothetical protein
MKVLVIEDEPLIRDLRKPVAFAEFKTALAEVAEPAGAAR